MMFFRAGALAAILLVSIQQSSAFLPRSSPSVTRRNNRDDAVVALRMSGGDSSDNRQDDPTKVWYAGIADAVQNVLTNSPLNEGKKALVKSLAGDYNQAAVRARLDGLIADKPVLMLSFRT